MEKKYEGAKTGQPLPFNFKANCIEMKFDAHDAAHQKGPVNGWIISPHYEPCKVYKIQFLLL